MEILKFGGSSVANPEAIMRVVSIIKSKHGRGVGPVVVVSAMSGVTDTLLSLSSEISSGSASYHERITALESRHLDTARELVTLSSRPSCMASLMALCNELSDIARGASLLGEVSDRTRDIILSFGERLSATLLTFVLNSNGIEAGYTDSRQFIFTDAIHGNARIDMKRSAPLIAEKLGRPGKLPVVTGFIGTSSSGNTTTLGRSGSDYTATAIGAALAAEVVEIWSDADGVMSADPALCSTASTIVSLTYQEAMELSHFGAKILFAASVHPAMVAGVPVCVKNTFNPGNNGTLVSAKAEPSNSPVKGITSLREISMVNVEGSGMVGVAGIAARLFGALWKNGVNVILISQASSEHSICIGIRDSDEGVALKVLGDAFREELSDGMISAITSSKGNAIVAVVGEGMRSHPGMAAAVFGPLGRHGINIRAIAQGSSELNISFVIDGDDLREAINVIHSEIMSK